jgi:hypothetical protein
MISRIAALVDAFAQLNGALDPKTDAYQLRNPLLLKAFSPRHDRDEKGLRRFKSFPSGYDNGVLDATIKCSGRSFSAKHGLGPESPLSQLVCIYGNPVTATKYIVNFLRHALKDDTIMADVKLSWFLETPNIETPEISEVINGTE